MELSAKLKQIRIENNMTQQELADVLCLSRSAIAQYEKGYKVPNIATLDIISNYFKTSIFDEYKSKLKHFLLSIKCIFPYLISIMILVLLSLCLVNNIVKVHNEYGYNIYNDELKVKNSDEILIVNYSYNINKKLSRMKIVYSFNNIIESQINIDNSIILKTNNYYLIFLESDVINNDRLFNYEYKINFSPFIYLLKDYDEFLPYDKQEGECRKILDYYIDLIEKIK